MYVGEVLYRGGGVVLQVRTVNGGEAVLVKIITISH